MRLGAYLCALTRTELETVKKELNMTDDEEMVFDLLAKGKSITVIADRCGMSTSTVSNRIKDITLKIPRI